nr:ATP-binding protein [uncultured Acetatifactor sp.]
MGEDWNGAFPVEDALEMILMFDGAGVVFYANAAARGRLGYTLEDGGSGEGLRGRHVSEVFPGSFKSSEGISEGQAAGRTEHLVMYRRNRTCFPVEAKFVRNRDSYICMANDMLEREHLGREIEQVREEAGQAARVKAEFVANVTHELRTPVNGILGNVRELLDNSPEEGTAKALRLVERCCGDMNKIIDNILDFSKLDAGKFTLELRKFHFRNMLDYVKAQHISRITEKGLDFFLTVSPQVPEYVVGDELRIVQILNNLLSNALKFTAVGKITLQVLLTARVDDKAEIFFIVSDTGIGIAEENRDKLFQSFSQVDASISRRYGGTGLGLNICKQLVELMGGSIEVESREGHGSSFSFSVWVGEGGEQTGSRDATDDIKTAFENMAHAGPAQEDTEDARHYGTPANREALKKNLSKLILSIEMENWEKAEMFMETVRQLTADAPPDIKRIALRLKMAIQKGDYEKVATQFDTLRSSLAPEKCTESVGREVPGDGLRGQGSGEDSHRG